MLAVINSAQKTIFGRLLIIFLVTATSIIFILSFSFKMATKDGDNRRSKFKTLFSNHANYLINDIGTPPNLTRAQEVADTSQLQIMITGPELQWKSSSLITDPSDIQPHKNHPKFKNHSSPHGFSLSMGRHQGQHFFIIKKQNYTYYLTGLRPFIREDGYLWAWAALFMCSLIIYLSYRAVNWLIGPLKQIQIGAQKIERGDISFRIDCKRNDEIGKITNAVNSMATELEKMLEAKRQLLLAISHELRTPLTRAKVGIEFVDNQKIKQSLSEDLTELEHLINELLEAERLNEKHNILQITPIDINQLLRSTIQEIDDPNRLIKLQLPKTTFIFYGDSLRLTLLVKNLVGNGLKYGDNKPLVISSKNSDGELTISFQDQGEGIEKQHLTHITEPFYRADNARQRQTGGYGLGLYLCKLIAEAHKGQLNLESTLGEGTTITVSLPINKDQ